jgi:hypothetical protein
VLAAAVASAQPMHLLIVAGLMIPSAAAFPLTESTQLKAVLNTCRLHWPTLAISVVALPVAAVFASDMATAARQGRDPVSLTWDFDHWPIQAAAALVIPLAGAVLSLRLPGWRFMVFIVAAGAAWFGNMSIIYPDHAGSLGTATGWGSIIWAAGLAGLSFHRRAEPRSIRSEATSPGVT